jgi:hypothetical protein
MNWKILLRLAAVLLALFMIWTLSGCRDVPTEPKELVDQALVSLKPELTIASTSDGGYIMGMVVDGGGVFESNAMCALRSIRSVRFDVYALSNVCVASMETENINASGVMNGLTGEISLTMTTYVHYRPAFVLPSQAYAKMTVVGTNGIAITTSPLPERK